MPKQKPITQSELDMIARLNSERFSAKDLLKISAEVHGRNEEPNTENLSLLEKARNFLVAVGGMVAGSKFQWKSLTEGLIKIEG